MNMVRMVTTSKHVYAGRQLAEGEEFDCETPHVRVMEVLGLAKIKEGGHQQTYETRDMVAGTQARTFDTGRRGRRKAQA